MCTCQDWKVLQCVIKDAQNCCSQYISISILPQAVRLPNSHDTVTTGKKIFITIPFCHNSEQALSMLYFKLSIKFFHSLVVVQH